MTRFNRLILDVCHETLDLSRDEIDFTVTKDKFLFQSVNNGYCVAVIVDETNSKINETGLHHVFNNSFSEYELSDLLEQACRGGYDQVIIHGEAV